MKKKLQNDNLIKKLNLLNTILDVTKGKEKITIENEIAFLKTHLETRNYGYER
jgi:hypothetical protein